jgi:thiol-disulfide isomerase/thioredoxin
MKKTVISLMALLVLSNTLYAQDMEITDTDGNSYKVVGNDKEIKIEGMEGKVVFLEFFGLNCPACKKEMPNLIKIQDKYKDKLKVVAVEVQNNDVAPINDYKAQHGINYTTVSNFDAGYLVRFVADKSGWDGRIPFMLAIDAKGEVRSIEMGLISDKELESYVEDFSK